MADVLVFSSAAASLVGRTLRVRELQLAPTRPLSVAIGLVTVASVCAVAAQVGATGGVVRGAIVGTIAAALGVFVPAMYLLPTIDRYCAGCTRWGELGIGVSLLVAMCVVLMGIKWLVGR